MAVANTKTCSYDDYCKLKNDKRYEIIEGELLEMSPSPSEIHQLISTNLVWKLCDHVNKKQLGRIYAAPFDVILTKHNVVQPDILFISKARNNIIKKEGVFGAPDLIIEILSSNPDRDKVDKFKIYEQFQVKEYWIIDPTARSIDIFALQNNRFISFCFSRNDEKIKSKLFLSLDLSYNILIQ